MRQPEMERARLSPFGVPGHLLRTAARDVAAWVTSASARTGTARSSPSFACDSSKGFVWTRLRTLVSVVIPCYNQGHFSRRRCAARCRVPIARRSHRRRRRVHRRHAGRGGAAVAACSRASASRIADWPRRATAGSSSRPATSSIFLDADDRLLPGAYRRGGPRARGASGVRDGLRTLRDDGARRRRLADAAATARRGLATTPRCLRTNIRSGCRRWRSSAAGRSSRLRGFAAGFDAAADYDLYLRIVARASDSRSRRVGRRVPAARRVDERQRRPHAARHARGDAPAPAADDHAQLAAWREGWRRLAGLLRHAARRRDPRAISRERRVRDGGGQGGGARAARARPSSAASAGRKARVRLRRGARSRPRRSPAASRRAEI